LSTPKNSLSCWMNVFSPSRPYRQPWYLQVNCRHVPAVSSRADELTMRTFSSPLPVERR